MESMVNPAINYKLLKSVCISLKTCVKNIHISFHILQNLLALKSQYYPKI